MSSENSKNINNEDKSVVQTEIIESVDSNVLEDVSIDKAEAIAQKMMQDNSDTVKKGKLGNYRELFSSVNSRLSRTERIITVIMLFVAVFVLGLCVHTVVINKQLEQLSEIKDQRLVGYEAYIATVNDIVKLYGVYNEESYQAAKEINFSPDLRNRLFIEEHYTGIKYDTAPKVEIIDVRYEYNPGSEYLKYLVTLNTTYDTGKTVTYNVSLEYKDNMIIRMQGY